MWPGLPLSLAFDGYQNPAGGSSHAGLPCRGGSGLPELGWGEIFTASFAPESPKGAKSSTDGRGLCPSPRRHSDCSDQGRAALAEEQPVCTCTELLCCSRPSHVGCASTAGSGAGQNPPKLQDAEEHRGICRAVSAKCCQGLGHMGDREAEEEDDDGV